MKIGRISSVIIGHIKVLWTLQMYEILHSYLIQNDISDVFYTYCEFVKYIKDKIISTFYEVYNELRFGFLESIYESTADQQ